MSKGKYSPTCISLECKPREFIYNALKQIPPEFTPGTGEYDTKIHFPNYDEDGYDSYGYSAFNANGEYVGIGSGVDRNGLTEWDYLAMSDDEFDSL